MIQIAEFLPPTYSQLWELVAQCGVRHVVGALGFETAFDGEPPWSYAPLLRTKNAYEDRGYSAIGRLFAIGYLKGIREAVYGDSDSGGTTSSGSS